LNVFYLRLKHGFSLVSVQISAECIHRNETFRSAPSLDHRHGCGYFHRKEFFYTGAVAQIHIHWHGDSTSKKCGAGAVQFPFCDLEMYNVTMSIQFPIEVEISDASFTEKNLGRTWPFLRGLLGAK